MNIQCLSTQVLWDANGFPPYREMGRLPLWASELPKILARSLCLCLTRLDSMHLYYATFSCGSNRKTEIANKLSTTPFLQHLSVQWTSNQRPNDDLTSTAAIERAGGRAEAAATSETAASASAASETSAAAAKAATAAAETAAAAAAKAAAATTATATAPETIAAAEAATTTTTAETATAGTVPETTTTAKATTATAGAAPETATTAKATTATAFGARETAAATEASTTAWWGLIYFFVSKRKDHSNALERKVEPSSNPQQPKSSIGRFESTTYKGRPGWKSPQTHAVHRRPALLPKGGLEAWLPNPPPKGLPPPPPPKGLPPPGEESIFSLVHIISRNMETENGRSELSLLAFSHLTNQHFYFETKHLGLHWESSLHPWERDQKRRRCYRFSMSLATLPGSQLARSQNLSLTLFWGCVTGYFERSTWDLHYGTKEVLTHDLKWNMKHQFCSVFSTHQFCRTFPPLFSHLQ